MTNYRELSQAWDHLLNLAPALFTPITDDEALKQATAALRELDREIGRSPERPHPLAALADSVMHRIMAYEQAQWPRAAPDLELRLQLDAHGLTQQQLAAATGISQSVISRLCLGERPFTADHARKLGAFFGVSPAIFL